MWRERENWTNEGLQDCNVYLPFTKSSQRLQCNVRCPLIWSASSQIADSLSVGKSRCPATFMCVYTYNLFSYTYKRTHLPCVVHLRHMHVCCAPVMKAEQASPECEDGGSSRLAARGPRALMLVVGGWGTWRRRIRGEACGHSSANHRKRRCCQ